MLPHPHGLALPVTVRHEKIVEVMLPEERAAPDLLVEDVKSGSSTPGPRIQRLAKASQEPESEVALFVMQFEAMRESTKRIAAGEDPDEVNESMMAGAKLQPRGEASSEEKEHEEEKQNVVGYVALEENLVSSGTACPLGTGPTPRVLHTCMHTIEMDGT